jgi:acetate kinase
MMTVVFQLGRRTLQYTCFRGDTKAPFAAGTVDRCRTHTARDTLSEVLSGIRAANPRDGDASPDILAIRAPFGGTAFRTPVLVDSSVIAALEDLSPRAPIHLPAIISLIHGCEETLPGVPIVAVFDTAFFADLPAKEHLYALSADLAHSLQLRRFGYHGILHQAACSRVVHDRSDDNLRILSICLEPRPELAAVVDQRPVMVTGGATPLEGLPGERSSGDIDPSIPLLLAQKDGYGLERINMLLTRESGLLGLVGEPTRLSEVFTRQASAHELARNVFKYRLLLACGAGMAAMDGLDAIVFSGQYYALGETLGPWLASSLKLDRGNGGNRVTWSSFPEKPEYIIAQTAQDAAPRGTQDVRPEAKKKAHGR